MNPKHLIALGIVGALFAAVATVLVFAFLVENEYRPPFRSDEIQPVPRDRALEEFAAADVAADEEAGARLAKLGPVRSRAAKFVLAQLPLLFLSFVLAVPILATILKAVGMISGDDGYDAVGQDLTRLLSVAFAAILVVGAVVIVMTSVMNPASGVFTPSVMVYAALFLVAAIVIKVGLIYGHFLKPDRDQFLLSQLVVSRGPGLWFGLARVLSLFFTLNLILLFLNLIPLPPLDGSRIVDAVVPRQLEGAWSALSSLGPAGLLVILAVPILAGVSPFAWPIEQTQELIRSVLPAP